MLLNWWRRLWPGTSRVEGGGGVARPRPRAKPSLEELGARTVPSVLPPGFQETPVVEGLQTPTSMASSPDGRLFITEKAGEVRVVKNGQLLPTPFLTVQVDTALERGMGSIVFDPNFAGNGFVYVYYTTSSDRPHNRLSRFTVNPGNPDVADPGSEVVMLDNIPSLTGDHNGGGMHFGGDGMLYLGVGDSDKGDARAQWLWTLSGKVLRLDVDHFPNISPSNNPFVHVPGARKEIWALGFRNPFTSAIKPGTNKLFVNDVGEVSWEEVDRVVRGGNYGWPATEGFVVRPGFHAPAGWHPPIFAYAHNGKESAVTGGAFYVGNQFPAPFDRSYFFGDFERGFIRRIGPGPG